MIHAHAAAVRNTNSAAAEKFKEEKVNKVVELDSYKYTLGTYEGPLVEVRDSL